ncbi:glycosyltransferase, partial [Streptomyces coriariae]|uniref:glycosyltransferase n=1 Tax=Streptomyces coriariae TaxID=2864460 RepID=UPI001E31F0A3
MSRAHAPGSPAPGPPPTRTPPTRTSPTGTPDPAHRTAPVELSVVIPAFNEERRLGPTLDAVTRYLDATGSHWRTWEILVADDGSTDATRELVTVRRDPRVKLVAGSGNRGKGHALRRGVAACRG